MECYSAFKKEEIPVIVITWMNLEDIRLNEISQSWRQTLHNSPYINRANSLKQK